MKNLRAKHNRSFYKNERRYLEAVYRNNKELIDATFNTSHYTPRTAFINSVKEISKDKKYIKDKKGISAGKAVQALVRSELFTEKSERLAENALTGLREDKQALNELRRRTGWNVKLDANRIYWDNRVEAYVYEGEKGTVTFSFENSPKGIKIYDYDF